MNNEAFDFSVPAERTVFFPVDVVDAANIDQFLTPAYQKPVFEKKEPVVIGYSVYDMLQPYWQAYAKGIEDAAKAAGYGFELSDQKSSEQTQVSGSIDLINKGVSALVVSPVQPPALPAVIDAAHEAKIPVIIGDVGVAGDYDAFVLSDNEGGGKMAAQYMVEKLKDRPGTKEVLVIELHPGSAVGEVRVKGFVDELAKYSDFTIVASLNGNDTVEGGYQVTQDTLSAHPELAGIYAANDPEAIGAVQVLKANGKNGVTDVLVVGFNADPPALELIKAGDMAATIRQDPYGQGQKAVEIATALMNNEAFDFSVPAERTVFFPVDVVDAANIDQFLTQ
jgi:ribose transport system substrate-binding protein